MTDASRPPDTPSGETSRDSLSTRLQALLRGGVQSDALREAVNGYVDEARRRGEPVERVIIDLKQEMRAAGVVDVYVRPGERALAEPVIRWCIDRYYGVTGSGPNRD